MRRNSRAMASRVAVSCVAAALLLLVASLLPSSVVALAPIPTVSGSVNTIFLSTFQQALLAYELDHPSFSALPVKFNSGFPGGLADATSGLYDFTVTTSSVPDATRFAYPTLESYPIAMVAIAPYYNLPPSVGLAGLTLTTQTVCRMWRGNITHWDDPAIKATNPSLMFPVRPAAPVSFVQLNFSNDASLAASRLCLKVDPGWPYGVTSWPNVPGVVQITLPQGSAGIGAYVLANPWAIGLSSPVAALNVPMANMVNHAGKVVSPGPATSSQAFLELSANGILPGGMGFDLSNAQSAYAWPVNMPAFVFIDLSAVRTTCATKASALKFLLWFYTSPVVTALANRAYIALPPLLYLQQSGLLDRLRREVLCDGLTLVEVDSAGASIRGNAMAESTINFVTMLYTQIDTTYTYVFRAMADALALDRISTGEIDFALVSPDALTDSQISNFLAPGIDNVSGHPVPGGIFVPAFLAGTVATFSLPVRLTALWATRTDSNALGLLPLLYPLKIDLETLGAIFAGEISDWLDARITVLNPQLPVWFNRSASPTQMRSVVCCSNPSDPLVATTMFGKSMLSTSAFKRALGPGAATMTPAALWTTMRATGGVPLQTIIDRESTSFAKLLLQPGSVGYRVMNTGLAVPATDWQLLVTDASGAKMATPATPDSMKACVANLVGTPAFDAAVLRNPYERNWVTGQSGCYPLMSLVSLAVGRWFDSANQRTSSSVVVAAASGRASHDSACVRAQKNLELLRWLQVSPVLQRAVRNNGLVRLSDFEQVRSYVVDKELNSATCDGQTILITLPIVWKVATAATIFSIVTLVLGSIVCLASIFLLYKYRSHSAIRGASPIFLAQVAVGIMLLLASLPAWASRVTDSSCMAFMWLVNLGFTACFAPLFAKTWRIYQIFSARKIKVVKISNGRLVWVVLGMMSFELIVLSVWSGVSPLQPVLLERPTTQLDGAIRQTTHCAVVGAGSGFLALEASFKGLLLLFGCMMGFSTRRVSASFNESSTIAYTIYNAVFSGLIVGAILIFLDTLGDTLIWIVLFLLLWIAIMTWVFVFVPKITSIVSGDEVNGASLSTSMAISNKDGTITFASIASFTVAQLIQYKKALEDQLDKVKKALGGSKGNPHGRPSEGVLLQHQKQQQAQRYQQGGGGGIHNRSMSGGGGEDSQLSDADSKLHRSKPRSGNPQGSGGDRGGTDRQQSSTLQGLGTGGPGSPTAGSMMVRNDSTIRRPAPSPTNSQRRGLNAGASNATASRTSTTTTGAPHRRGNSVQGQGTGAVLSVCDETTSPTPSVLPGTVTEMQPLVGGVQFHTDPAPPASWVQEAMAEQSRLDEGALTVHSQGHALTNATSPPRLLVQQHSISGSSGSLMSPYESSSVMPSPVGEPVDPRPGSERNSGDRPITPMLASAAAGGVLAPAAQPAAAPAPAVAVAVERVPGRAGKPSSRAVTPALNPVGNGAAP